MYTSGGDIFNLVRTGNSSYIIDYLDKELRNRDMVFIDISLVHAGYHDDVAEKISEVAQEMLLTSCNNDITRIDISFNVLLGGSADNERYTIMKCKNKNDTLIIVKTRYGFIFARGGADVVERVLNEVLNNIKSDIVTAETLVRLCNTTKC